MKRTAVRLVLSSAFFAAATGAHAQLPAPAPAPVPAPPASATAAQPKTAGHWEGAIHMGAQDIPMALDLAKNTTGAWIGSFSIPSAQITVPMGELKADDSSLHFTISIQEVATFEGTLSAAGDQISGSASSSQGSTQFEVSRTGEAKVTVPPPSTSLPKEMEGRWEGTVDAGGNKLRLAMVLSTGADGKAAATFISIDQGGQSFPASTVKVDGMDLTVAVSAIGGSYNGTLGPYGDIGGDWTQGGVKMPLVFKKIVETKKP
jgi:hypothetical protein